MLSVLLNSGFTYANPHLHSWLSRAICFTTHWIGMCNMLINSGLTQAICFTRQWIGMCYLLSNSVLTNRDAICNCKVRVKTALSENHFYLCFTNKFYKLKIYFKLTLTLFVCFLKKRFSITLFIKDA